MNILVYGSREFGRVVCNNLEACGHRFAGFVDDSQSDVATVGDYASARKGFSPETTGFVIAVGYKHLDARWRLFEKVVADGYRVPPLIHPRAYLHSSAVVADGVIVMATASIDQNVSIGALSVVWPGAVISHDSYVGQNCFISPGAVICGYAKIGIASFVGAGAIVVDHCSLPDHSFVKAGERLV